MSASLFHILNISQVSMLSHLQDLDITSNNLANVNTAGFKAQRGNFQELLAGLELEGVRASSSQLLLNQGSLRASTNPLDLAIQGEGFFAVTLADGRSAYTRDGQFQLDANRQIVTAGGQLLDWQGQIPADFEEVAVDPSGVVSVRVGSTWSQAGTIQTHRFPNPTALLGNGENLWLETPSSGGAVAAAPGTANHGQIRSQSVEMSNVNMAGEMTHMMTLQRAFQMSTRTFQQTDQMISLAISMRRG